MPTIPKSDKTRPDPFGLFLVYYGYRYYSPSMGRFINRDPLREAGGINIYAFTRNNPINKWDYLGMCEECGEPCGIDREEDDGTDDDGNPWFPWTPIHSPDGSISYENPYDGSRITIGPAQDLETGLRYDPITGSPVNTSKEIFKNGYNIARIRMYDMVDRSNLNARDKARAKAEADRIVDRILDVIDANWGKGPWSKDGHNVGSWLCWDWAKMLSDAIKSANPELWKYAIELYFGPGNSDYTGIITNDENINGATHAGIILTVGNQSEFLDDGIIVGSKVTNSALTPLDAFSGCFTVDQHEKYINPPPPGHTPESYRAWVTDNYMRELLQKTQDKLKKTSR